MQRLFYISTPPSVFEPIIENLGASGMASAHAGTRLASKVIIEKPFGRDLESARALNASINKVFDESQVYRIDHYLGKETVQDLLVQRFANSIFEPLWNREYVDNVQITVAESLGVGSRGGYYDTSGALRDMIQNHTMQLVALTAMEPPVSLDPESIRDEKSRYSRRSSHWCWAQRGRWIRGRYTGGLVNGKPVEGYLDAQGIPADSTRKRMRPCVSINNWRWKGVPFYIRSGQAHGVGPVRLRYSSSVRPVFCSPSKFDVAANTMVIRIQPDEGVTLVMNSKVPGWRLVPNR